MILEECCIFLRMFAAGLLAGTIARILSLLGSASQPARAVTDALIAAEMGAFYFLTLYMTACGVFRVYSLAAFALGIAFMLFLLKKLSPTLRKAAKRVLSPLLKGLFKLESSFEKRLSPLRKKLEERKRKRREKAEARALLRQKKQEERAALRKKKKMEAPPFSKHKKNKKTHSGYVAIEH